MADDTGVELTVHNPLVEVGSIVRGRLVRVGELQDLATSSSTRVRELRLALRWVTEGRATTDSEVVDGRTFPVDEYGRLDTGFELAVPPTGPISYDGRLVRVRWRIEVEVDIKLKRDTSLASDVVVVPRNGFGVYQRSHPLPTVR